MKESDHHLTREEAAALSQHYAKASEEWLGKIVTGLSTANAGGLAALIAYVSAKSISFWPLAAVVLAALLFTIGLFVAFLASILIRRGYIVKSWAYESILGDINFENAVKDRKIEEDFNEFKALRSNNRMLIFKAAMEEDRSRDKAWIVSLFLFLAGFAVTFSVFISATYKP